jgi:hypothetical protein
MNSRPSSIKEVAEQIIGGYPAGMAVKDFLHEFQEGPSAERLREAPAKLGEVVKDGLMLDAFLQALAVYLSVKAGSEPPAWTHATVCLKDPWFASPGPAIRNYLLMSSPAPFRSRNLFIDEDSLTVA